MEASPFVLSVLKYAFLALLYFFIYRAIRSAAAGLSERRPQRDKRGRRAPKPAGKSKPPVVIVVRSADGKKIGRHKLSGPLQIGRGAACDIRPDDDFVSEIHARLQERNGAWHLEDLGSTNGTYLNGRRVQGSAEVHSGDEVRVGRTVLEMRR